MSTLQRVLVYAITFVGAFVAYFIGLKRGKKDFGRKDVLNEILNDVFEPHDSIAFCENSDNGFTKEQKEAIVSYMMFLLKKFEKVVEKK